jgi:hypothetical protein
LSWKPAPVFGLFPFRRKNFLFAGADTDGERAAALYTPIGTAKLNSVDPEAYLRYVLTHIADRPINQLDDLLARNVAAKLTAAIALPRRSPDAASACLTLFALPPMAKFCKIIILYVQIEDINPPVWRRIAVDGGITLRLLHHILQTAFGWTDSHLHEFTIGDSKYQMLDNENVLDFIDEMIDTPVSDDRKAKLQRLVHPGQQFVYLYDFGDSWRHIVTVEAIETRAEPMYSATIINGQRAGPPEDVGGAGGYAAFLDTLINHSDSDEALQYLEWVGGEFDSEAFDRRIANNALARLAWNGWG